MRVRLHGNKHAKPEKGLLFSYPLGIHVQVSQRWAMLAVVPVKPHKPFHDNRRGWGRGGGISQPEDSGGQ